MSSPTEAKLVLLQRKLDKSLEGLEEYIDIVREEGSPRDYKDLVALYTTLLQQERLYTLSQMYLSEPLAVAAERLLEKPDDQHSSNEVTALLKAI